MASQDIFKNMHNKLFEEFKSQDVENGYFDVCFKIEEKLLHAHKVILAAVSKPFGVMFAERWTKKSEPIELTEYSYDEYKELLTFIYSGACELKDDNVFNLLDMSECYDVADFKSFCDAFLALKRFTCQNVFQYVELARRYSLVQFDEALKDYISMPFWTLLRSDEFMKSNKSVIEAFVDYAADLDESNNERCFDRVLEWAQKRAETKMTDSNDENFDLQNGIKNELSGITMRFKFSKMSLQFLHATVAKHSYLFSGEELSNLLLSSRKIVVTVTNSQSCTLIGQIPYDREIFDILFPVTQYSSSATYYSACDCWDRMQRRIPTKDSSLKKNNRIPFYLVLKHRYVCLFPPSRLEDSDYLIAEMKTDYGFDLTEHCHLNVSTNF